MKQSTLICFAMTAVSLGGAIACMIGGSVAGVVCCVLLGAAGLIAFWRKKEN